MNKINTDLSLNQKVSSPLAFGLLLVLGFAVAWYTVNAGQEVLDNAKKASIVNIEKRWNDNEKTNFKPNNLENIK